MTAGRPIGQRIRQVCTALEEHGPRGARSLCDLIPGIEASNMGKYCKRDLDLGLITVERGLRQRDNYSVFTVRSDWEQVAAERASGRRTMNVPVGKKLIELCQALESIGPATCTDLRPELEEWDALSITQACCRGVSQGVVIVDGTKGRGRIYKCAPDWKETVKARELKCKRAEPKRTRWTGVASVFQMGAR